MGIDNRNRMCIDSHRNDCRKAEKGFYQESYAERHSMTMGQTVFAWSEQTAVINDQETSSAVNGREACRVMRSCLLDLDGRARIPVVHSACEGDNSTEWK